MYRTLQSATTAATAIQTGGLFGAGGGMPATVLRRARLREWPLCPENGWACPIMTSPDLSATGADAFGGGFLMSAIEVRPSPLRLVRRIVDVMLSATKRRTDVVDKFFTRLDLTRRV